jgi:LacI family transcriptional regulator
MKTTSYSKSRPATLSDVARQAGVALSTASAALNDKGGKYAVSADKRAAVLRAAQDLNFEANPHAKRLSNGRDTETIGMFTLDIGSGVTHMKLRLVQLLLTQAGFNVPIYSSGGPEIGSANSHAKLIASLRIQRPYAIVSTAHCEPEILEELNRFQQEGGTVASYDFDMDLDCDQMILDREKDTYVATRYLLELGHRKIGYFRDGAPNAAPDQRLIGFKKALDEFGGETRNQWLCHSGTHDTGTMYENGGILLAEQYLSWRERPTAMCIVNDASAAAFISTVIRAGLRVPEDVSVVGHDDLPIARIAQKHITTVSHPVDAISRGVTDMLLERLQGKYDGPARRRTVSGELIIRESAAPI